MHQSCKRYVRAQNLPVIRLRIDKRRRLSKGEFTVCKACRTFPMPTRFLCGATALFSCLIACLFAPDARAASLQQVNGWSAGAVPNDVSMYLYVPDAVVENPPVLVLIHYCGGTADAVFGQARGGGIVAAADKYGFIMVVPSSGRCWDVVSDKTRTRDAGGDSHAIRQMVSYAVQSENANADRVYATGDSSGGMMTELLMAVYPDVFKAGSALAGMPAGCRASNESGSGGGYSGACAGGMVTHTPEEWGDIARSLAPGYEGHRPRVQLFHGDADTIIRYPNHTEAIKEWSNVLGLSSDPDTTDNGVPLGDHQATRLRWQNSCGFVVLDAFASLGGDHGPSDALFLAEYVIPFLGLDQPGPLDPEIEQCESGVPGEADAGGAPSSSGTAPSGGVPSASATSGGAASATAAPASTPSASGSAVPPPSGTVNPASSIEPPPSASSSGASTSPSISPSVSASAAPAASTASTVGVPNTSEESPASSRGGVCGVAVGASRRLSGSGAWMLLGLVLAAASRRRSCRWR
jgi:acetylxylan esterase